MKWLGLYILSLLAWLNYFDIVSGYLNNYLEHYETIHISQLKHKRTRRDTNGDSSHVKQINFYALGRDFNLYLERNEDVLSSDFKVYTFDGSNKKRQKDWRDIQIYKGYVIGEEDSSEVQAIWEDDDLTATITTKDDVYSLEPSWRHLPKSENFSMIAYRRSDMKDLPIGRLACGYGTQSKRSRHVEFPGSFVHRDTKSPGRARRDVQEDGDENLIQSLPQKGSPTENTCQVLMVADFKFFNGMGLGSVSKTSAYLIGLLDRVDAIFRKTDFGQGYQNMGFEVKEIRIHQKPTNQIGHYNSNYKWEINELLEAFSREDHKAFCLAHLFTYQHFAKGVLGLARISSEGSEDGPGGICSERYNTAWSTLLNEYRHRILTQQADLVTTHEFGHNWGAMHDPDSDECSPSERSGGKYIMYTYSVSGYESNNMHFSPCSKRWIRRVLQNKASACFKEKQQHFCGNHRVERQYEQCDVGPRGQNGDDHDPCCGADCKLLPNAKCSDSNDVCCENCTFSPKTKECYKGQDNQTCNALTYCTGTSASCPEPNKKKDKEPCSNKGECWNGTCVSFCEVMGQVSCICDDSLEEACKWCCKKSLSGKCKPYTHNGSKPMDLPDGMPCIQGTCSEGHCKALVEDLTVRIGKIIKNITPDQLVNFMKTNIVSTVILLSLIVWIPASCIVSRQDRKLKEENDPSDFQSLLLLEYATIRRSQKSLHRRYIPNIPTGPLRLNVNR